MGFLAKSRAWWDTYSRLTPTHLLYDRSFLWLFLILLFVGFIMVTSAAIPISTRFYDDPFYFAKRDLVYIALSLGTCYLCVKIPMAGWQKVHGQLYILAVLLLLVVLIPGIGKDVNGATRWIPLKLFNFQPAEFIKLALCCYLAGFFYRKYDELRTRKLSMIRPGVVFVIPFLLLLLQPDLGSGVVLIIITFGMLFILGASIWQFFVAVALGVGGIFALILFESYRLKRLTSFLDPFQDPFGSGFQLSNSLMAFGRGEFLGNGLGNSIQKLEYLPEAHTDFVMAVLGEEFGFVGILVIIALLTLLVFRAFKIAKESLIMGKQFEGFFAFGLSIWIFFQGFVNLGMSLGLLPTKGLTFPLVSYGGSSLIIMSVTIAILLRIDHENRIDRGGHAHLKDD